MTSDFSGDCKGCSGLHEECRGTSAQGETPWVALDLMEYFFNDPQIAEESTSSDRGPEALAGRAAGGRKKPADPLKGPRGGFVPTGEISDAAKLRNELRGLDRDTRRCRLGQEQPQRQRQESQVCVRSCVC